ncbi:MAG: phospho-N-acetylmuramoyl-pentapeptide-transferase [Victivallales bacterium]|nr:phospho-N-acetylmuramoyl-pentapeptide-transferase [Victivallales bacterium]
MLYLLHNLENFWGPFRLFQYVTLRAGGAFLTAFFITLLLGPFAIQILKKLNTYAPSRHKGLIPEEYIDKNKDKTPSMGGILIVVSITIATILWAKLISYTYIFLFTTISLCILGFIDDYSKVVLKKRDGTPAKLKFLIQLLIAVLSVLLLFTIPQNTPYIYQFMVPFYKEPVLTGFYGALITFPLGVLVVIGASNAVNLTDGKDGLAIGPVIFCAFTYAIFAYLSGNYIFAGHLDIHYISGAGEVGIFAASIIGAGIGFLWYNCYPASMFMGDTGSLALGGSIGLIAVLVRKEIVLLLVGGVFVMEALSVILQVGSFKLRKKRIFLCAPIHHHFERKGWTETQIVVRFWILAGIFALLGLATLKLR